MVATMKIGKFGQKTRRFVTLVCPMMVTSLVVGFPEVAFADGGYLTLRDLSMLLVFVFVWGVLAGGISGILARFIRRGHPKTPVEGQGVGLAISSLSSGFVCLAVTWLLEWARWKPFWYTLRNSLAPDVYFGLKLAIISMDAIALPFVTAWYVRRAIARLRKE